MLVFLNGSVHPGKGVDRTLDIVAELSSRHDELISCGFVSAGDFGEHDSPLLFNVRREGVTVGRAGRGPWISADDTVDMRDEDGGDRTSTRRANPGACQAGG